MRDISETSVLHLVTSRSSAYLPAVVSVVSCQEPELAARRRSLLLLGAAVALRQWAASLRTDTAAVKSGATQKLNPRVKHFCSTIT
jgi:alkylhydroperoxidase/carboxymuconolactone decarboxylase family protein YurZ